MTVQETTFNSPYQKTVYLWLQSFYGQNELPQKMALNDLVHVESIKKIQSDVGYQFKNINLLITALTHSTFCYEYEVSSNEKLEFLGDSLVNFIVAKALYKNFPNHSEGDLSKLRGALVNEEVLSLLAKNINLGENLLLGKGEFKNNGHQKNSLLADAFEALLGAIYNDSSENIDAVERIFFCVINRYEKSTNESFFSIKKLEQFDSKTQLQEIVMGLYQIFPKYKAVEEKNGFLVELWIGERKIAEARGPSKKKLEKELARMVLDEKKYQF